MQQQQLEGVCIGDCIVAQKNCPNVLLFYDIWFIAQ